MEAESSPSRRSSKATRKRQSVSRVAQLNSVYYDTGLKEQLGQAFQSRTSTTHESSSACVYAQPFTHFVLPQFIKENSFLEGLKDELLDQIFYEKNNDLYKFQQSDDLKKISTPYSRAFRRLLKDEFVEWLREVTGIPLSEKVDATCSRYDCTDTLLCHDDELEGRRIAYILYLVPTWKPGDGGSLDLFDTDEQNQPRNIVKSLEPVWNNFVMFEVTPASFHQVAEVLTEDKTRLSVNGWFHGPPIHRPKPYAEPKIALSRYLATEEDMVYDWINPVYLEPEVQGQIQEKFEADSEIELQGFLKDEKYQAVLKSLKSEDLQWTKRGPANKRNYHQANLDNLPEIVQECMKLFQSEALFLILSNMTGLTLHELAAGNNSSSESEDEGEGHTDKNEIDQGDGHTEDVGEHSETIEDTVNCEDVAVTSEHSGSDSEGLSFKSTRRKKRRLTAGVSTITENNRAAESDDTNTDKSSASNVPSKEVNPQCRGEIRRWQHGSYTLLHDTDSEGFEFALDAMLFFSCKGWQQEFGGFTSYLAKGEDEELLTVTPSENSLALVYRDKDTLRFVKHVNSKAFELSPGNREFYDISFVYYE